MGRKDESPRSARWRAGASVVAVLVIAACGSSSSDGGGRSTSSTSSGSSGGSGRLDLCTVVTADDAATVFGAPARTTSVAGTTGGASGICLYEGVDDPASVRNLLQVRVYDGEQYYGERTFPESESVDGIGDKAFVNVNAAAGIVDVQFVKGGRTGAVNYSAGPDVDVRTKVAAVEAVSEKLAKGI